MGDQRPVLRIGHSPDPDDAFMWWPLGGTAAEPPCDFDSGRFRYEAVLSDIDTLNRRSEGGDLELTALSCAQYSWVKDRYAITSVGSSLAEQRGPTIVANEPMSPEDLIGGGLTLAVPGEHTSAFTAASILLGRGVFSHEVVPFDEIIPRVKAGEFPAGLVIHEGQMTYEQAGLHLVADLGMWWESRCGLPLPLGINAIRWDLTGPYGEGVLKEVTGDLRRCLEFALSHRRDAMAHALRYGRDLSLDLAERFVNMYVNRWTLDLGSVGRAAIETFLKEAHRAGLAPEPGEVAIIG